jgi:hypothetical protein
MVIAVQTLPRETLPSPEMFDYLLFLADNSLGGNKQVSNRVLITLISTYIYAPASVD